MAIIIGRAIEGISINGNEYLLTEKDGPRMEFGSVEDAKNYLVTEGVAESDLEFYVYEEIDETYVFTFYLTGTGLSEGEALTDAIDSFVADPGEPNVVRREMGGD